MRFPIVSAVSIAALALASCAGGSENAVDAAVHTDISSGASPSAASSEQASESPTRITTLDIDETAGVIRIATDRGVFVAPLPEGDVPVRVIAPLGERSDEIKAYQRLGTRVLISGHPSANDPEAGERLGLWLGDAETGEWQPFALAGEVDFHSIAAAGPSPADAIIAAADTVTNTVFYSPDGGESWQKGGIVGATSLAFTADGSALVAATPVGVKVSTDRGRKFADAEDSPALQLLATPPIGTRDWRIVGVDAAGVLWSSTNGTEWRQFGEFAAIPAAIALGKSGEVVYVATPDGVFVSNDGGATLTLMLELGW
jgi:hypothetical protein